VSGVSTGAFIAPFAFLGTQADYETIDHLFRNPKPDWVERRGLFFFLPENASLAEVPGLVRELRAQVDLQFAGRIAKAGSTGGRRVLLIQATDIDNGTPRAFDAVAAAREAVATGNTESLSDILISSAAIPGVFPPVEIQGQLANLPSPSDVHFRGVKRTSAEGA
jgi:predicted acylesterase/phospholipase RssA